ncbi:MAG: ester cyclase, partial [Megasphaera elsdenii]|nr:ester cyclase [Megasphaera elsdenii]
MNKKSIILGLTLALVGCLPMGASFAAGTPHFKNNKAVAEYFWNEVFNKHDTAVIDTMVGPKYKQHSPEFADGKQAFKDGVSGFLKAYPDSTAVIKHIGADGDLV